MGFTEIPDFLRAFFHIFHKRLFYELLPGAGHLSDGIADYPAFQSRNIDAAGFRAAKGAAFDAGSLAALVSGFRFK